MESSKFSQSLPSNGFEREVISVSIETVKHKLTVSFPDNVLSSKYASIFHATVATAAASAASVIGSAAAAADDASVSLSSSQ